jgi:DNA polymerase bacteriophage-type
MSQPYERILTLDMETRWSTRPTPWSDTPYTLSSMTTEEYIRDPRFKAFGACIHEVGSGNKVQWYGHDELPRILGTFDWTKTAVLAHNAMFDVGILSFIYDVHPCFIFDSLSMGRALRGVEVGNSLAKLADVFGLPPKGRAVHDTNGLLEITPEIEKELAIYCAHDVFLCEQIFSKFLTGFAPDGTLTRPYPKSELRLIDMTLKMFTEPELVLDVPMLEKAVVEDEEKLQAALSAAGVEQAQLASNPLFAELLTEMGVTPPMKTSRTTGKPTLALAKTDAMFQAMLNGDREDVALLCEARLRVKSTGERTRAQRFIGIAGRGALPVPLSYYGAGTGRYAATGSINLQNLKRGSFLRKSIMAPPNHQIVAGDLAQIEPRVLAWLAGYDALLDIFRAGGDPYATFGSQMFGIPGLTKESHPLLRQSAKSGMLGAGYQLGWSSFAGQLLVGFLGAPPQRYTKADAKLLGVTQDDVQSFMDYAPNMERMMEIPHTCSDSELLVHCLAAKAIIDKYRAAAAPVVQFWELLQHLLVHSLIAGNVYQHKCLTFKKGEIVLANGMSLLYPDIQIEQTAKGPQYTYDGGKKRVKLYAGKVCNNCIAEGTPVFTTRGWVPIENVTTEDRVHDGTTFVDHKGLLAQGVQTCVTVDGVYMTPEHEVLTNAGWVTASQSPRPYRPEIRDVGCRGSGVQPARRSLALSLRLREAVCQMWRGRGEGSETWRPTKLRLSDTNLDRARESTTRFDRHTTVDCVGKYARAMQQPQRTVIPQLRRTWNYCVQALGDVREFFSGHGAGILVGIGFGTCGQQQRLYTGQYSLGYATREQHEQAQYPQGNRCAGTECADRSRAHNDIQQDTLGLADRETRPSAVVQKQVFDIVNCGPRKRFVVMGTQGPFIVHNCTQGTARIVMTDGMLRIQKRYRVKGTVHDEAVVLVPDAEVAEGKVWIKEQMIREPKYLPGIPLNADVGASRRYGDAKK